MKKNLLVIGLVWASFSTCLLAQPQAVFMSAEATHTYFKNGFDGDEFNQWTWENTATNRNTWYASTAGYISLSSGAVDNYKTYNPASTHSLAIAYSRTTYQNEVGTSQPITVLDNSNLGFWLCPGVFKTSTGIDITKNYDYTICMIDEQT
ncbi:MAG: hypothetical protein IJ808_01580 [Muribaculaceae bacterium]|nr:hypothetical protein [Muribaculaceae bacterium]